MLMPPPEESKGHAVQKLQFEYATCQNPHGYHSLQVGAQTHLGRMEHVFGHHRQGIADSSDADNTRQTAMVADSLSLPLAARSSRSIRRWWCEDHILLDFDRQRVGIRDPFLRALVVSRGLHVKPTSAHPCMNRFAWQMQHLRCLLWRHPAVTHLINSDETKMTSQMRGYTLFYDRETPFAQQPGKMASRSG
jgi:hypothetical protein